MTVLCGMATMQYSAQSARFFKLNDLHMSIFCDDGRYVTQ